MTDAQIIAENERRKKILFCDYNPATGIGSQIERFPLKVYHDKPAIHLPLQLQDKYGAIKCLEDEGDNFEDTFLEFMKDRLQFDFEFWAWWCIKIKPKGESGGLVPFRLNWPQRFMLAELIKMLFDDVPVRVILVKARQWGGSTLVQMFMMWIQTMHKTFWNSSIVADVESQALGIRAMYEMAVNNYRPGVQNLSFKTYSGNSDWKTIPERNCIISIGSMQKPDKNRQQDISMVHASEVGSWKKTEGKSPEDLVQSLYGSVLNVPYSVFVLESTAKGQGNYFHTTYLMAEKGNNNYLPVFVPWWKIELYHEPFASKEEMIRFIHTLNEYEQFLWELGAALEGIKWYRTKLKDYNNNKWRMGNEFPSTCLVGDTMIGTNKGIIPIRDIIPGMICGQGEISSFMKKGKKKVYKLTTNYGYTIECTEDHLIKNENKWAELGDLSIGDTISLSVPKFSDEYCSINVSTTPCIKSIITITEDFGRFLGIYMGDGSFSGETISIACDAQDVDFIRETQELVESLFGRKASQRLVGKNKGCNEIRLNRKSLQNSFLKLGIAGKRLNSPQNGWKRTYCFRIVCVPECIWKSPKQVVKEFLRGVFETDGFCKYKTPRIILFSKHMKFLEDIQILLLGFGITSIIKSKWTKNGQGYEYQSNTLVLNGEQAVLFGDRVGFLSRRKQAPFSFWKSKTKTNKRTKNILKDKIKTIEFVGEKEVFDITVKDSHCFDANGILVHNCEEAFSFSSRPVFNPSYTANLKKDVRDPDFVGDIYPQAVEGEKAFEDIKVEALNNGPLSIWAMPNDPPLPKGKIMKNRYAMFVDIGGTSQDADFSAITVIDRYYMAQGGLPEAVATWHGHLDQDLLAWKAAQIARFYENAYLGFEVNSLHTLDDDTEGDHSYIILDKIANYYDNLYTRTTPEQIKNGIAVRWGFHTNHKTKGMIVDNYRGIIRNSGYVEYDKRAYDEASWYIVKENGKLGNVDGQHDDLLISRMGALWLATSEDSGMGAPEIVAADRSKIILRKPIVKTAAKF